MANTTLQSLHKESFFAKFAKLVECLVHLLLGLEIVRLLLDVDYDSSVLSSFSVDPMIVVLWILSPRKASGSGCLNQSYVYNLSLYLDNSLQQSSYVVDVEKLYLYLSLNLNKYEPACPHSELWSKQIRLRGKGYVSSV